jgi:hypothetical protein
MRSIGELMKDMGFNKDAPVDTQKAFIRHLIKAANENQRNVPPLEAAPAPVSQLQPLAEAQLSFDPTILGTQSKKSFAR